MTGRTFARLVVLASATFLAAVGARAEDIAIGNYGSSANGMPFGIALAKGYFQEEGANVTGIIASEGGGTSVRNAMAGVAYGEANPGAIAVAIQQGADLRIVSDNVLTIAEFAWLVKKDSPIKTIADLKGKKIGYTNPRSTSQALDILMLKKAGLKPEDAELVKTGGFGPMVAALDLGQIDVAPVTEPLWSKMKDKFRVLITGAEALPPLDNVVGVVTAQAAATRGDFIRAVIRARRKAIKFMKEHPEEAGQILAKPFNITPEVATSAIKNLTTSMTEGIPYWGEGDIHLDGMKRIIEVQKSVGALTGDIDLSKVVDTQFLPDDLKKIK
ncbi:MAG TPA: ABC transporter substrate-binding protein [Pseudolabrys sp.]|nr:ABC transporter substrate-binding protein [Pseudolabrys sp.]